MRRIYLTHCCAKKDNSLRGGGKKVTPDKLYTSERIQRFMNECKKKGAEWAIFSDKYGVVFPNQEIEWYDKHPSKVTDEEFEELLKDFDQKLASYDEIWFYYNPGRLHPLYKRLSSKSKLRDRIRLFTHIKEIR
jgi:phenylalanyl-tRNA synthetase alpha subunit